MFFCCDSVCGCGQVACEASTTTLDCYPQINGLKSLKQKPDSSSITRRQFVSRSIASVLAAPAIIPRETLASSGELNLLMWSDAVPADLVKAFEAKTGIKVKQTLLGSNQEFLNKMKATRGRSVDLLSPSNTRAAQWAALQVLQPFDLSKLENLDNIRPNMLSVGERDWNFDGLGQHWLPHLWGSEAIAWRTDMWQPPGAEPSYGDLWQSETHGKIMMQPHSGMLAVGLYLESQGELPTGAMRTAYNSEEQMRAAWDKVTAFCVQNKSQVKLFWNEAEAQKNALLNEGVLAGQSWDGPILALKAGGEPVSFQAPREGALAWVDGFALSKNASNVPQAYAFLDFCFDAQTAGEAISSHGYNSAILGAEQYADAQYQQNYRDAYPGAAVDKLWIWPSEPAWYAKQRTQYRNKFVNA